jgi:polyisoprenoid-binding protein YceI
MAVATRPFVGTFEADRNHSSVVFGVHHMQVSMFRGSFGDLEARLVGDDAGVRLEGAVRVASISISDPPEFRGHVVRGADFFDADNHPVIRFRSDRVELAEDGSAKAEGELTMKGINRSIVAAGSYQSPVADPFGSQRAALELRAVLDRRDWGLSWQMPVPGGGEALAWEVELTVHLELVKQD